MKRMTFPSILRRSLTHRRARSLSALVALTVSAAVATALLTLYADLNAKLHKEFRNFGANVVVTASASSPLPPNALAQIQQAAGPDALVAPFAYVVATTDRGTAVVVAGTNFPAVQHLDAWWDLAHWPTAPDAALIGDRAANFISNKQAVKLTYASKPVTLTGVGLLKTGGDEDSRIYIPLPAFTQWTGIGPSVIEIQIPGGAASVEAALTRLRAQFPSLQIQPVRQLVEGESRIVDRTHSLMYGSVLLIALTVAVSVLATLSASVLERRRDFALMKALGGSQTQLMSLFLLEALVLALTGVVLGYIAGSAAAWAISQANFHTATLPRLSVLPLVLLLNIAIAALAALFPVRVLRGLQPAALLKGE
jgi:putative ABC transport system permease protein